MNVSWIMDFVLIVLLVCTLIFCYRLNRRLEVIRDTDQELKKLLSAFGIATENAKNSVHDLKTLSESHGRVLEEKVSKAQRLADELSIMTEAGSRLADRLERGFSPRASPDDMVSTADHDLLRALRRVK